MPDIVRVVLPQFACQNNAVRNKQCKRIFFFFSSRRRHTRSDRDWSSDVCSSDLGMLWSKGILTTRGGATSHASVVARGLGLPCVVGAESIRVDYADGTFSVGEVIVHHGDAVSIDGTTGGGFLGRIPTIDPDFTGGQELLTILSWADKLRRLEVWANADYPRDAVRARAFGAEGVGLCRTEHMFFEEDRLPIVQRMILAASDGERQGALAPPPPVPRAGFGGV